jgi:tagatose-1,6-bisphosphate aldolase
MDKEKIVDFPNKETITKEDIEGLKNTLGDVLGESADFNMMDSISAIIAMPEEQFRLLAPGILQSYKQSLNNPNDKVALVQALNASGGKAEDVTNGFMVLADAIDKLENISRQKRDFLKEMIATICNAIVDTEGIAKKTISIPIELCHEKAKIPQYANISDSGLDLYALEDITVGPGETKLVATGIKVALPPGYELQVRPKSGRALKTKLRVANTPGTIDAGYRDEIKVIIENI